MLHARLQTLLTGPHTAAMLLFPACGYPQIESGWHRKSACLPVPNPVSLCHTHAFVEDRGPAQRVAKARSLTPPFVIT